MDMNDAWYVVGMDTLFRSGQPVSAGLFGPFDDEEAAQAYMRVIAENGTTHETVQLIDPASYPQYE
jgi:hypothetical protein